MKKSESQGLYIDSLRIKYPFRIYQDGYYATLCGVQPLNDGQCLPIYRFPGGSKVVDPQAINKIIDW